MAIDDQDILCLMVRCHGLQVPSNASFHVSTFTNLLLFASGNSNSNKNEKRYINILQSEPFKSPGRPSSLRNNTIYTSEVIDEISDISPILVANVSNRTGGKFVLLASCTFTLQDYFSKINSTKSTFMLNFTSEYCVGAKLYVQTFYPFYRIFKYLDIFSKIRSKNPLIQKYALYSPHDKQMSSVNALETGYEPKYAFIMSEIFLSNLIVMIENSLIAWRKRYLIEKMKCGNFKNANEALSRGWNILHVTVLSSNITMKEVSSITNKEYSPQIRLTHFATAALDDTAVLSVNKKISQKNLADRKNDERLPSSYVRIIAADKNMTFTMPIGKTNIEWNTLEAVYGSNVNANNLSNKKHSEFMAYSDDVLVTNHSKQYTFLESETTFVPSQDLQSVTTNVRERKVKVSGDQITFIKCIPSLDNCSIEFELCFDQISDKDDKKQSKIFSKCSINVADIVNDKAIWLPMQIQGNYSNHFSKAEIKVCLKLTSPEQGFNYQTLASSPHDHEGAYVIGNEFDHAFLKQNFNVPPEFNEAFRYIHHSNGKLDEYLEHNESIVSKQLACDIRHIIPQCYEWQWGLGEDDCDPLLVLGKESNSTARLDVSLDLSWLKNHVVTINDLLLEIKERHQQVISKIIAGHSFRPSQQKKQDEVQALPINLHYQLLAHRKHEELDPSKTSLECVVTCGSFAAHGLGFKEGGLFRQSQELDILKVQLNDLKTQLKQEISQAGGRAIPHHHQSFKTMQRLSSTLCNYESASLRVLHRRIFCMSQALSVVVNSFLLKFLKAFEGYMAPTCIDQWIEYGFLVVFQGLLSVVGKEKGMIEDTIVAVQAMNSYEIRLRLLENSNTNILQYSSEFEIMDPEFKQNEEIESISSAEFEDLKRTITLEGHQVCIFLPNSVVDLLSDSIKNRILEDKAIIPIRSVLFSQGIDIQQSYATAFSNEESSGTLLQSELNLRGLRFLNSYCHTIQPINQSAEAFLNDSLDELNIIPEGSIVKLNKPSRASITSNDISNTSSLSVNIAHPLVEDLFKSLIKNKATSKNTDMIFQVERLSNILRGCRVVFCKSGKDRTGMVVSYEQIMKLNEKYLLSMSQEALIQATDITRLYGVRLDIAEKNIHKRVFSINLLQAQFLPVIYRPPSQCCEDIMKKDMS